jgi:selenium metabolism protein YedF
MKEIDCRGMACPQPVVTAKKALDESEGDELVLIVDNLAARDNVKRFAQSQEAVVSVEEKGNDFYLHIQKSHHDGVEKPTLKSEKVVVYINSNLLGGGDEDLGSFLMKAFLKTLLNFEKRPDRLILINSGVRLASEGSEVLEPLTKLSEAGTEILSCGTCLEYYELKGKLKVGVVSNMFDIIQSMLEADRVIRP